MCTLNLFANFVDCAFSFDLHFRLIIFLPFSMFSFLIYLFPSFNCSDTMGFSGQMNGWGLCAKYSLFVANFVIFVSLCDNQSIHQIPTFSFSNFDFIIDVIITDRRCYSIRFGHLDASRQKLCQWITWNQSVLRGGLHIDCYISDRVLDFVLRLFGRG